MSSNRLQGFSFGKLHITASASLDRGLRENLHHIQSARQNSLDAGFALPAAALALSGDDVENMKRLFSKRRSQTGQGGQGSKSAQDAALHRGASKDAAMCSDSERAESVASDASLLALLDEGWFHQQPNSSRSDPGSRNHSAAGSGAATPAAAPAGIKRAPSRAPSYHCTPSSTPPPPHPPGSAGSQAESGSHLSWTTAELALDPHSMRALHRPSMDSERSMQSALSRPHVASPGGHYEEGGVGRGTSVSESGWETPRSWVSSQISMQQAQLEHMDLSQLEVLAAEAAALQRQAQAAMQFQRQRLGPLSTLSPPPAQPPLQPPAAPRTMQPSLLPSAGTNQPSPGESGGQVPAAKSGLEAGAGGAKLLGSFLSHGSARCAEDPLAPVLGIAGKEIPTGSVGGSARGGRRRGRRALTFTLPLPFPLPRLLLLALALLELLLLFLTGVVAGAAGRAGQAAALTASAPRHAALRWGVQLWGALLGLLATLRPLKVV